MFVQCICQCPIEFANASAPPPSSTSVNMAEAGRKLLQPNSDAMSDELDMSSMMGSDCGPVPTQYESFTQVSYIIMSCTCCFKSVFALDRC